MSWLGGKRCSCVTASGNSYQETRKNERGSAGPAGLQSSAGFGCPLQTQQTLPALLTDLCGPRRSLGSVIPILCGRDIRHPPLVAVPAVETIHLEAPVAAVLVAHHDETVGVAHVHAEHPAGACQVGPFVGVVVAHCVRVGGI